MNREKFLKDYWRYYLCLEEKFYKTIKYVEIAKDNFPTYSIEYAYLLQSVGSEIDSFFKLFCGFSCEEHKTIKDYKEVMVQSHKELLCQEVRYIYSDDIQLQPFVLWSSEDNVSNRYDWWRAYNKIKHNRSESIKQASQINVISALAGLFLLEMAYLKEITKSQYEMNRPENESEIFALVNWEFNCVNGKNAVIFFNE